jgi:UDP-N-acetylglucosamine 3-dehydrogenase
MIKVAVIGIGNMGKHHARIYSELKNCNLVAVCDLDKGKKSIAKRFGCRFYTDYKEMLTKEEIDAVSIAVPTIYHKDVALDCIKHGKHVMIEKPIADQVEHARKIINIANKNKVKVAVGHTERFNPAVQRLKDIINRGGLGNITTLIARRVGVFPPQIKDANVVIDLAVHDIDVFNYLLDKKPTRIYAMAGKALIDHREDYADILLKYDGTNAFIQVNWITPVKIRNLAVTGTKGYAELNYITQELVFYKSRYWRGEESFSDVVRFGTPKKIKIKIKKAEPLKIELNDFLNCIKNNKQPLVTGEDGLCILKIASKAIKSYKR